MIHNILITCGTSQIDADKIRDYDLLNGIPDNRKDGFFDAVRNSERKGEDFYQNYVDLADELVKNLVEQKARLEAGDVANSPFGAEISTLEMLKHHQGADWPAWNPGQDHYVLLASDTGPGYFCAQVLRRLLIDENFWAIPANQVSPPVVVETLIDSPSSEEDAKDALLQLVDRVKDNLIPGDGSQQTIRNVLVMTGGYKSIIPYLTLFSLFYGIELLYLFERSSFVYSLFPDVSFNGKAWDQWWAACDNLKSKNQQNQALTRVLEGRPPSHDRSF